MAEVDYDIAYYTCPKCGVCECEVPVTRFSEKGARYNLEIEESLAKLDDEQLKTLKREVLRSVFRCPDTICGNVFNPYRESERRLKWIRMLFEIHPRDDDEIDHDTRF